MWQGSKFCSRAEGDSPRTYEYVSACARVSVRGVGVRCDNNGSGEGVPRDAITARTATDTMKNEHQGRHPLEKTKSSWRRGRKSRGLKEAEDMQQARKPAGKKACRKDGKLKDPDVHVGGA